MNRPLAVTSLVLSVAALVIAISGRFNAAPSNPDPAQVRVLVDAELQRRESELVTAMAPKFRAIYQDMLGPDTKLDERALNPKTLADLLRPLVTIIEKMQGNEPGIPPQK